MQNEAAQGTLFEFLTLEAAALNRHIHNGEGGQKTSNQQDLAAQGDEGGFASRPRESSWSLRCAIPWIGIGVLGKLRSLGVFSVYYPGCTE